MFVSEVVRFNYLNQLSKQEKQALILKLLNNPNDIITKSLFKHFSDNQKHAKNVNHMISKIIRKETKFLLIHLNIN